MKKWIFFLCKCLTKKYLRFSSESNLDRCLRNKGRISSHLVMFFFVKIWNEIIFISSYEINISPTTEEGKKFHKQSNFLWFIKSREEKSIIHIFLGHVWRWQKRRFFFFLNLRTFFSQQVRICRRLFIKATTNFTRDWLHHVLGINHERN